MGHREDLLAGARRCLSEKGYARTTARDIVAVSGTNLGSIGYHYGSTKALMNAAMLSAVDEWGQKISAAMVTDDSDSGDEQLVRLWRRIISTARADRELFMATVEAMVQAEHAPELREQMADGIRQGRSGMAAMITGQVEESIDRETVRTLGSVQMALMSGVLIQWMTDPENAPSAEEVVAGIKALAGASTGASTGRKA
ncbi:TetR/AcrR family transcriptional regulator [Actinoplanes sp. NPDC051470]|uniref:TetR/AcrR family transcriptional regulator n=1 Tax=unclassified Actinoplanes TaxID=2626549 RepID=UPI003433A20D